MEAKKNAKQIEREIEAVLFYTSESMSLKDLARLTASSDTEILFAIESLKKNLEDRGITLIESPEGYSLATSPEVSKIIERVAADELSRDISAASLEVLSIIAYKGNVTRREIEHIRGVNSSYSLRNLLLRGLIEKEQSRLDERVFIYKPTTELLKHLGIRSFSDLPEWKSMQLEIGAVEKQPEEQEESHIE